MPIVRFAVRRADGFYWKGGNLWGRTAAAARWFSPHDAAEHAALIYLPDRREAWSVVLIPLETY